MSTVTVSLITGVVFGLAPALQATRPALVPALKDQSPAGLRAHRRFGLRNALVVTQVAVSLVLLTVAGLFVRSLQHAQDIDPGFERERAIVFMPVLSLTRSSVDERRRFTETLRERLRTLPGVDSVVLADRVPLGASVQTSDILVEGQQPNADGASFETDVTRIGPEYFAAMRIPLVSGRDFTEADGLAVDQVIVVSEAFAAKAWPGQSALGRRVTFPARPGRPASAPHTVVGVARDTKVRTLGEAPRPYLYRHWRQTGEDVGFVVRTHGDPQPLVASVRREALALEPDLPVIELKTMREHLSLMLTPPKLAASLLAACGVLAILLANLGLYAVVAYSVARRTREIGVRIALGAHRSDVLWLVIREGMALVLVGVVVGFALTAAIARPLGSYLYGLGSLDPLTFTVVATILAATALVANFVPARRAVRVDPLQAIRCE
jgi:predicted permease